MKILSSLVVLSLSWLGQVQAAEIWSASIESYRGMSLPNTYEAHLVYCGDQQCETAVSSARVDAPFFSDPFFRAVVMSAYQRRLQADGLVDVEVTDLETLDYAELMAALRMDYSRGGHSPGAAPWSYMDRAFLTDYLTQTGPGRRIYSANVEYSMNLLPSQTVFEKVYLVVNPATGRVLVITRLREYSAP